MKYQKSLIDLEREFVKRGIDFASIGFYDNPTFLKIERAQPDFLANYANYVNKRAYSPEYLQRAQKEIPFIAEILHSELVTDGRLGACVDASIGLSRILEKEGFWNYIVKGSLTIEFPTKLGIANKHFWSVDVLGENEIAAAHAWVVAPPYYVVDITVSQQPYQGSEKEHIPKFICSPKFETFEVVEIDLISPSASEIMTLEGIKGNKLIHIKKNYHDFIETFKPCLIELNGIKFKYITIGISAPDEPLEKVKTLKLSGKFPLEIYNALIKPKLGQFRAGKS
nr:hypothetical protein [Nitrosomonas nitrosa]